MGKKEDGMKGLKQFIAKVVAKLAPRKVILFGSRARGDNTRESDYDIIIISEKFKGIPFTDRMTDLYRMWDILSDVDFLCYTQEEFDIKKRQIGIVRDANSYGKLLVG